MILLKCDLTEFDGKVHPIAYYVDETYKGKFRWNQDKKINK